MRDWYADGGRRAINQHGRKVGGKLGKSNRSAPVSGDTGNWRLSRALVDLGGGAVLRLRDLVEGVFCWGGNGSGKSSTSLRLLILALLGIGAGALMLTSKDTDVRDYLAICRRKRRMKDVIVVRPGGKAKINVIAEAARHGTEEVVDLLRIAMAIADGDGGRSEVGEKIWDRARDLMLRNLNDLARFAGRKPSLDLYAEILSSAPQGEAAVSALQKRAELAFRGGKLPVARSVFEECWDLAAARDEQGNHGVDEFTRKATLRYWSEDYPGLPERTRGSIKFSFDAMVGVLLRGDVAELCCTETTFTPADSRRGKIIIVDLPIQKFGQSGRMVQALIKRHWQREMERKAYSPEANVRPVLQLMDEGQNFLSEADVRFQATSRSSRVCTVIATQSIASLRQQLGSDGAEELLGVLQIKICHACDGESARFMADLIGEDWNYRMSFGGGGDASFSDSIDRLVQPIEFSRLARGGPEFGYVSEAFIFKPGARWGPAGKNFVRVGFSQR